MVGRANILNLPDKTVNRDNVSGILSYIQRSAHKLLIEEEKEEVIVVVVY